MHPQYITLNGRTKDIAGNRYGRLVALGPVGRANDTSSSIIWHCRCDCGNEIMTRLVNLRTGDTRSCGCLNREHQSRFGKKRKSHGMSRTQEYNSWCAMIARCENTNNPNYGMYGARGIRICLRWRDSFDNFLADIGHKPASRQSVDRIDVNGHYSCGNCEECVRMGWKANCRWANHTEQANNTRQNHFLEFCGERLTIAQWSQKLNINRGTLLNRIKSGWPIEKALTTPAKHR